MYGESRKRFTAAVRGTCSHCMRFVASPNYSTDISVKVPGEMKSGCITKHIFGYTVRRLQVFKERHSRMCK